MSIFDDLSNNSYKKTANKQSGARKSYGKLSKRSESVSAIGPEGEADTEFATSKGFGESKTAGVSFGSRMADEEIASDMMTETSQYGTQTYTHAGVAFNKISDREAKIDYTGLLQNSGATEVTAVYGYGSNQNWENVSTVTLSKDASGRFIATIPIESGKNVNLAFKDAAQNWDNNSGLNYTFVN
jgi:hydrogenase maturation factor